MANVYGIYVPTVLCVQDDCLSMVRSVYNCAWTQVSQIGTAGFVIHLQNDWLHAWKDTWLVILQPKLQVYTQINCPYAKGKTDIN